MPIGIILIITDLLGKESLNTNQNTTILNATMALFYQLREIWWATIYYKLFFWQRMKWIRLDQFFISYYFILFFKIFVILGNLYKCWYLASVW